MKLRLPWCQKHAGEMVLGVGLQWGAGSPLVAVPPVPWGHTHLQKQFRGIA